MLRSFFVGNQAMVKHLPLAPPIHQSPSNATNIRINDNKPVQPPLEQIPFAQIWDDALLPYLGTRLALVIVGLLATYYILPLVVSNPRLPAYATQSPLPQSLWLMWQRFDSGFYLAIARQGYSPVIPFGFRTNWVFYPLYPLLIAGVGKIFGGMSASFSLAGLFIANTASLAMIVYFYLLVRREFSRKTAERAVIYLSLFPTAFFLSAIYTESLLLGFSIACIYYTRRRTWWLAGLCGGLATLTRLQGITLVIPMAWEYLRLVSARYAPPPEELPRLFRERIRLQLRSYLRGLFLAARELKNWATALALGLVPAGLLAFMVYGQIYIGDFFATFHASKWEWGRQVSPPWRLLIYSLRHPILGQPLNWNFWTLNIVMTFAFLAIVVWAWRRLPMVYVLYTAATVLLPLASSSLNSIARYYLLVFPVFILLALLTTRNERQTLHNFILASFATLQAVLMVFFVLGIFAIA